MDKMLRRLIGEDIALRLSLAPRLPLVEADAGQIEQVLVNLVVNARDAMPQGGELTIETALVQFDEPFARAHLGAAMGDHVMVAVRDTGTGMSQEVRERLFEPFFTTKAPGKGTGLGLATVYGIIKQHQGYIHAESAPGQGTTFRFYLPASAAVAEAPALALPQRPPRGQETILVVEDEAPVRALAVRMLRRLGYTVLEAAGGEEALRLAAPLERLDLLFTDVVMPQMNGHALAETLCAVRPGLKVIFASGYTDDIIAPHGVLGEHLILLSKPFTADTLAKQVRRVLDGHG
jgi:CheY-like chemotaxis protein